MAYCLKTLEACAAIAEKWRDENKAQAVKAKKRERLHGVAGYESPQMADMLEGAAIECNAIAAAIRELGDLARSEAAAVGGR